MMPTTYQHREFSSLDDLCELITRDTASWDTCWYRGCTKPNHSLLPTIFRDSFQRKREGYLAIEFRRRSHLRLKGIKTPFDWLCAMQHHGLPTRLLDWTESLAVALYFSIGNGDWSGAHPTIWVLNPFALAALTEKDANIPIAGDSRVEANADIAFRDNWEETHKQASRESLPVAPNFLFDRISAQNGTFTIHGSDERALEEILAATNSGILLKFAAREDRRVAIVNSIRLLRPSADAMFPDIEGMKTHLL